MTAIWLRCVKCGKQTDTEHAHEGVCRTCIVDKLMAYDKERYLRLIAKRKRYEQHGKLRQFNDSQRIDAERKVVVRLRTYAPWMSRADLEKYLLDCRLEGEGRLVEVGKLVGLDGKTDVKTKMILVAKPSDVSKIFADSVSVPAMLGSDSRTVGANEGLGQHRKFKLGGVEK